MYFTLSSFLSSITIVPGFTIECKLSFLTYSTTTRSFSVHSSSANHLSEQSAKQCIPTAPHAATHLLSQLHVGRLPSSCEVGLLWGKREVSGTPVRWEQKWVGLLMSHSWKLASWLGKWVGVDRLCFFFPYWKCLNSSIMVIILVPDPGVGEWVWDWDYITVRCVVTSADLRDLINIA